MPGSFKTDLAALRRFHEWAEARAGIPSPVRVRVTTGARGEETARLEASPAGVRRAGVERATPGAYQPWRQPRLRGVRCGGLPVSGPRGGDERRPPGRRRCPGAGRAGGARGGGVGVSPEAGEGGGRGWWGRTEGGRPGPPQAWSKTFTRASERADRALAAAGSPAAGRLRARPHMLRHSFALRWYCIATFASWHRRAGLAEAEQRDFRDQLGDAWRLLASLLGHRSAEPTRLVDLEPFQALHVEHLLALMDADDGGALERLVDTLAATSPP